MSDNSAFEQILIIFMLLIVVAGNLGLNLQGTIGMPEMSGDYTERPGAVTIDLPFVDESTDPLYVSPSVSDEPGIAGWLWQGMAFFAMMLLFHVPGMPAWMSAIFLIMSFMMLFIVLKWVRGTGGG